MLPAPKGLQLPLCTCKIGTYKLFLSNHIDTDYSFCMRDVGKELEKVQMLHSRTGKDGI